MSPLVEVASRPDARAVEEDDFLEGVAVRVAEVDDVDADVDADADADDEDALEAGVADDLGPAVFIAPPELALDADDVFWRRGLGFLVVATVPCFP